MPTQLQVGMLMLVRDRVVHRDATFAAQASGRVASSCTKVPCRHAEADAIGHGGGAGAEGCGQGQPVMVVHERNDALAKALLAEVPV